MIELGVTAVCDTNESLLVTLHQWIAYTYVMDLSLSPQAQPTSQRHRLVTPGLNF